MRAHRLSLGICAGVIAIALAACGSDDSSSDSGGQGAASAGDSSESVSYAKDQLAKYTGPADVKVEGGPFDASKASGKTVWYIPLTTTVPAETSIISVMKDALSKVGVSLHVCDAKGGDPVASNGCMTQAIRGKAGAIIPDALPVEAISASLKRAQDAGIPTIVGNAADPSAPLPDGADAQVAYQYTLGAKLVADWVIADSGAKANVLVIDTNGLSLQQYVTKDGYEDEFATHCPACKVTVKAVPSAADWATKIGPLVTAALTADPNIDYVIPEYDAQVAWAGPAIRQKGKGDQIKIATYNADLQQMQQLADGDLVHVNVGSSQVSIAWAYADQALRLMAGEKPVPTQQTGTRVFTADNVKDLNLTNDGYLSGEWYGPPTFTDEYLKAWGAG